MSTRSATRTGLNALAKSVLGLPYRASAREAWAVTPGQFALHQDRAFRRAYAWARSRVPYYRDRPDLYPPVPAGQDVYTFLGTLPVLDKEAVRQHNEQLWPERPLPLTSYHGTSGTSGTPVRLPASALERSRSHVIYQEWVRRLVGTRWPRTLVLSGFMTPLAEQELFWRDRLTRTVYLSIYSLTAANRGRVLRLLADHDQQLIYGYASAVHQLAALIGAAGIPSEPRPVAIVTSEVLQPEWREVMEHTLCRRVYNLYGSQEGSHQAVECDAGRMHIHPLQGVIEIVDDDGRPAAAGAVGRVLVTGFLRPSMPLVRYELGDRARSTGFETGCRCGLGWPTIGEVEGRSDDLVRTRDGRRIGYLGGRLPYQCTHGQQPGQGIREGQLVQLGYERFVFNIVEGEAGVVDRPRAEAHIRSQIALRLQTPVDIEFCYVPEIPRSSRGKFRAVVVDFPEDDAS